MISQDKKSLEILGFFSVFPACAGVSHGIYYFLGSDKAFSPRVRG